MPLQIQDYKLPKLIIVCWKLHNSIYERKDNDEATEPSKLDGKHYETLAEYRVHLQDE